MTNDEYLQTQVMVMRAAALVMTLDLQAFIERIGKAETLGPILDPTLYLRGGRKMEAIREIAEAADKLRVTALKHLETLVYIEPAMQAAQAVQDRCVS